METEDEARARRALARSSWPIRKLRLDQEGDEDAFWAGVAPSDRVAMVWQLSIDAWAMSGKPFPGYSRAEIPGRLIRAP